MLSTVKRTYCGGAVMSALSPKQTRVNTTLLFLGAQHEIQKKTPLWFPRAGFSLFVSVLS